MPRAAVIALLLLFGAAPVLAQTAAPKAGEEAQQMTRVLVLGDGVGGGMGAGLLRMGEADGHFDVVIRYNEESGLARPEVYDWVATLPKIFESNAYDVVVVLIGANDRQTIRSGNLRLAFNTPDWIAAYRRQVDLVLDILKASGAKVIWVSIPPMADTEYDAAMRAVTGLQKERVEARGFTFLDIRAAFEKPGGGYTDTGPDDAGTVRKLRGRDGISFFRWGNNRFGQLVLQAIQGGKGQAPAPAGPEPVPAVPEAVARQVPLFGQSGYLGEAILLRPVDVTVSTGLVLAAGGEARNPAAVLAAIRTSLPKGSAAEKLFTRGEVAAAPKGRADDFAVPPAP